MDKTKYFKYSIFVIIFFTLASTALMIFVTSRYGPGISEDSVVYIAGVRNMLNGNGLSILLDSEGNQLNLFLPLRDGELYNVFPWPPLFPFVISIPGFLNFNLVESARWINAILFGANIALILLIIRKYTKSLLFVIFSSIIFIGSIHMIQVHFYVWSEPLFLFFSLLGFYFLFCFLKNSKIYNFFISSLSFSLAFFTRTVGISLIATGVVAILFFSKLKIKNRISYSVFLGAIGLLPSLIWNLKNKFIFGYATSEFLIHSLKLDTLKEIIETVSIWFHLYFLAPLRFSIVLLVIILITVISTLIFISIKRKKADTDINDSYKLSSGVINIFSIFTFFYIFSYLSAKIFFYNDIRFDGRALIPVFVSTFIIIILFIKISLDFFEDKRAVKFAALIFCEIFIVFSLIINVFFIKDIYQGKSYGYNSKEWLESDTINKLESIPITEEIYTNDPYAIYYFLDRNTNPFPAKLNIKTKKENLTYTRELNKTMEEIRENNGLIVLFDLGKYYLAEEKELVDNYKLTTVEDTGDGSIYKFK
jgi:hypothetical protein